jgi:hypothetical protein
MGFRSTASLWLPGCRVVSSKKRGSLWDQSKFNRQGRLVVIIPTSQEMDQGTGLEKRVPQQRSLKPL